MGIDPATDIAAVVLTHFHHDHTGGLDHFLHTRIIGPRANHAVSTGLKGMMMGCLPQRWPVWLNPELVDTDGPAIGPFPGSYPLTKDGRIALVPTPGHVAGHCAVIVRDDDVTYFLAGDATYSQENLIAERTDGVTNDPKTALATLRAIKAFAAQQTDHRPARARPGRHSSAGSKGGLSDGQGLKPRSGSSLVMAERARPRSRRGNRPPSVADTCVIWTTR